MSKLVLNSLDLNKNEIQNARVQNLASAPSSPVEGQMYYDTTLHQFGVYQNGTWTYLAAGTANAVTQSGNSGSSGRMKVSAGADRTIQDYAGGAGIVKSDANGVVSAATAGTDYVTAASTNTLTNKTFDANGTGNTISNIETADFASGVIDTDGTLSANSDTKLASQKAIKTYVDSTTQGLKWKEPVRVATAAALPTNTRSGNVLTASSNGSINSAGIDGVTDLALNERVLVKDEATASKNGLFYVSQVGDASNPWTLTRATDADSSAEILGMVVDVREGTVNQDTAWVLTNDTVTLNTTSLTYVDYIKANVPSATTSISGKVQLATQAETEAKTDTSKAVVPADLVSFPIKKTFTIGDGSTTALVVTHNLNTRDVVVMVRDASTHDEILVDVQMTSVNTVTLTFAVAPASNAYKVVVIG
jgi:hypothetical protein